jgi:hypothetical protein
VKNASIGPREDFEKAVNIIYSEFMA